MSDNPRPVLYGSGYEAFLPRDVGAPRPQHGPPRRQALRERRRAASSMPRCRPRCAVGDLLATPVTGAYGHSMASNYNKLTRPPVVFVARRCAPPGRAARDLRGPDPMRRPLSSGIADLLPAAASAARSRVRRSDARRRPPAVAPRRRTCTTRRSTSSTRRASTATRIPGEVVWTWVPYEEDPSAGQGPAGGHHRPSRRAPRSACRSRRRSTTTSSRCRSARARGTVRAGRASPRSNVSWTWCPTRSVVRASVLSRQHFDAIVAGVAGRAPSQLADTRRPRICFSGRPSTP